MQQLWFEDVKYEIELMERNMARDFRMKAGHVLDLAPVKIDETDKYLRPALVMLFSKLFSGNRLKAIMLASVIQFIHFATVIHNNIKDNEDKFRPQLPVLIGDYLYSKFFAYLAQNNALEYLAPLSEVISEMHTGGVVRREIIEAGKATNADYYHTLQREHGLLVSEACRIAAAQSGATQEMQELSAKFGLSVGTAWGALKQKSLPLPIIITESLASAYTALKKLPSCAAKDALEDLLKTLENYAMPTNLQGNLA